MQIEDEGASVGLRVYLTPAMIWLWIGAGLMLALARHGEAVVGRGRPRCQFCGNPMDPEGHVCPATNGHRAPRT